MAVMSLALLVSSGLNLISGHAVKLFSRPNEGFSGVVGFSSYSLRCVLLNESGLICPRVFMTVKVFHKENEMSLRELYDET